MTGSSQPAPPRLALVLLRLVLTPDRFEAIEGDLAELFALRVRERGARYAQVRYWRDAVSVLVLWRRAPRPRHVQADADARLFRIMRLLRDSCRRLAHERAFSLTASLTLALGIGATTIVFTVVHALLSQPEISQGHGDLVIVWGTNPTAGQQRDVVSGPTFLDLQRENQTLAGLAAFHFGDSTLAGHDRAGVISTLEVTPEFFAVTGVRPAIGRGFAASDATADADVVVLSHGFWQRQFGGDPDIIGRTLRTGGHQHRVIGVLGSGFRFFDAPDVVTLLRPQQLAADQRTYYVYWLVGRLKDGVPLPQAEQDLDRVMAQIVERHPSVRGWDVTAEPLDAILDEPFTTVARLAVIAVVLVLVVACANVASLVLTRHVSRRRELAIRTSLGASRARVFLELTCDVMWLSLAGGVAGVAIAVSGLALLGRLMPPAVALAGSAGSIAVPGFVLDRAALFVALAAAVGTLVVCGLAPAWRATRQEPLSNLLPASRGSTAGAGELRLRGGLVSLEIAFATVLLVVAALIVQTVTRLNAVDPGFRGERVVSMVIGRVDDLAPTARAVYYTEVLRRVAEVPRVTMAALNDYVLLTNEDDYEGVEIEGRPRLPSGQWPREEWRRVSAEYFRTLSIPIVRGRDFTPLDTAAAPSVVIVNDAMARKYWPAEDPVGRRIRLTAAPYSWSEIVGVAGDVREVGLDQPAKPMMFVPYHRAPRPVMALFARVDADTDAMIQAIQGAVWSVDPTRPVFDVRRIDRLIADSMAVRVLAQRVSTVTALLALLLTGVGIFGTLGYAVSERKREIGVRVAVGARRLDVVMFVLRQAVTPTVVGLGAGLVSAIWLSSLASHLLYGISAVDVRTYVVCAGVLIAAVLTSSVLPALDALSIDPVAALKGD